MAIYHHTTRMIGRSNGGSPVKALAYISGISLADQKTGEMWNFKNKSVEEVQILIPENAPAWARDIQRLVQEDREKGLQILSNLANGAEKRIDGQVYREIEFSLPRELTYEQNKKLAEEYVQDQFCSLGMLAIQCFHTERNEDTGELNPHCHTFFLTRELMEGPEGSPQLSETKNREWNKRELHATWREQWAQYASFYLKMHGHDITLDHRSYKDQGLDIEPQIKLGKGVKEQEKRSKMKETSEKLSESDLTRSEAHSQEKAIGEGADEGRRSLESSLAQDEREKIIQSSGLLHSIPATERVKALREVQLRNLYRILRRPETVFDIVTRHHATFMWGDVQKVLGRYVDEVGLFQRLEARLRGSKELLLLRVESAHDQAAHVEDRAIYTTRSMLKAEKKLVETAESLAGRKTHAVSSGSLVQGLGKLQEKLQKEGYGLSEGQEKAIRHLVGEGQLKCIVGYAGAGKTTALEACREIWEAEGYAVYGLAPTWRAAQNLEGSGLSSQTLHKFLKSFEEGRSQYSRKSILVLDEAGMVDVGRFDGFLEAVKALGVKAVVVGDAAQLQPVEAGPAFRLVTERIGVSRLEEVVRQKVAWQREATVLFGKQESQKAIQAYQERGHIHLIEEKLPGKGRAEDAVKRYEMAARTSGLIFREIMKDIQGKTTGEPIENSSTFYQIRQHEDFGLFLKWRDVQKEAGKEILDKADVYRPFLEERRLDPLEMARLFVDKGQSKVSQYQEALDLLKAKKLDHLVGVERLPGQTVEVRSGAKAALIEDWQKAYREDPKKSIFMMAYSNRDVRDLNTKARDLLKASGDIEQNDFTYRITREIEDDFGRKMKVKEDRDFSKGDRIIFTGNHSGLGIKKGSLGHILSLNKTSLEVKLDQEKVIKFSPNLFPYFDQGWAVTIHKTQGINGDKSLILASHEMNQNLAYVAMTRHREDVQVYGSQLDFWREEKVADILSKSGEKLGAADYLDAKSLASLMKEEDRFLNRLFTRLSDELHAMGAVSKRAFQTVADHFLGRTGESLEQNRDLPILLKPETIREEDRAHQILQKASEKIYKQPELHGNAQMSSGLQKRLDQKKESVTLQDVYEDMKHPAFKDAAHYKRVFEEGLKLYGEEGAIQYWQARREDFLKLYEKKLETIENEIKSPLLTYLSDTSRGLTRKAALEDPDKALNLIHQLQASKQAEHEAKARSLAKNSMEQKGDALPMQPPSFRDEKQHQQAFRDAFEAYFRFKELKNELNPYFPDLEIRKEMRALGKAVFKHKEAFEQIKHIDPDSAQDIQQHAQEKKMSLENDLNRGRGGLSL